MRTDLNSRPAQRPPKRMTHLADGSARMVDVGDKPSTRRVAIAEAWVEVGPGVTRWQIGDQVCALLPGGGYAEYVVTQEAHALPIPKGMSLKEAACLPETCFTVWSNVVMRGGLKGGERFLVHGGTSGIGTTAIQIARALGARVFATAGSDEK